jgi:flavin-dependent dehydrogenase
LLRGLNCWERFLSEGPLESHGTICSWGSPEPHENEFVFSARGNGWHVDRRRFDAMMCECAESAGVEVHREARITDAVRANDRWRLATRAQEVEARFVIDSTGRSASFATRQGSTRDVDDNLTAVFMTFAFPDEEAPTDMRTLVEARPEGWWYSSIVPGERVVVAWMSDADLIRDMGLARDADRLLEHLRQSSLTAARLRHGHSDARP